MKTNAALAAAVLAAALSCGCRTTKDILDDYEKNMLAGNYPAMAGEVAQLESEGGGSLLLWRLLSASAYRFDNRADEALAMFDKVEDCFIANDQTSVFAQAGEGARAMLTNDRAFPYDGGGQDRVFTCLYKAIDYAAAGRRDAARTELNRAAQHQENWVWQRRKDIAAAEEKLAEEAGEYEKENGTEKSGGAARSEGVAKAMADDSFAALVAERSGFDPRSSGNLEAIAAKDYMNAYALHLTGVFRWLNGDGGRDFLKDAASYAPQNRMAARDFAEADAGAQPTNQVWIYVEDGLCSVREEWRIDLPTVLIPYAGKYVMYAGMALPRLRERGEGAAQWSVAAGGAPIPLEPLEDADRLIKTEFDVYMRGALAREITRTIVKTGVQVALGVAADNTNDWKHQLALRASQAGVAIWAATSTAADLRCWSALPKRVLAARVERPAGGRLELHADSQRIAVELPPGNSMVFVRKPGPAAAAVVKCAPMP